jgi:hypothetical protein
MLLRPISTFISASSNKYRIFNEKEFSFFRIVVQKPTFANRFLLPKPISFASLLLIPHISKNLFSLPNGTKSAAFDADASYEGAV